MHAWATGAAVTLLDEDQGSRNLSEPSMCLVLRGLVWLVLASGLLGSEANFWELRHLSASSCCGSVTGNESYRQAQTALSLSSAVHGGRIPPLICCHRGERRGGRRGVICSRRPEKDSG